MADAQSNPATVAKLAQELFESVDWRNEQNAAAGRRLTVKEMFAAAEAQAAELVEAK